jgi:phosphoserine phosphatase
MNMSQESKKVIKFMMFDLDGVLVDTVSSWVYLHEHFGVNNDPAFYAYMRNDIDDHEFMRRDIKLWLDIKQKFHIKEVRQILDTVPIMPGFESLISGLRAKSIGSAIISAGLDVLANRVANLGEIQHVFANGLKTDDNGYLTGEGILNVKLRDKGEVVKSLISKFGIKKENIAAVGNGEVDIPMFKECGFSIAFNPHDENIIENADVVIKKKDLNEILKFI